MISIVKYGQVYPTTEELNAHADKLAFNTREEYFEWVKQWKEVYNNAVLHHRIDRLYRTSHDCVWNGKAYEWKPRTSKKALYKQAKLEHLKARVTIEENELLSKLTTQIKNEYNYTPAYGSYTFYNLIHYLLAVRRASKLRAAKKREERLASQAN